MACRRGKAAIIFLECPPIAHQTSISISRKGLLYVRTGCAQKHEGG